VRRASPAAVACACALLYGLSGLLTHWHFGSSYDLAIFDQVVWHLSRLETPASTVGSFTHMLGDHFHPIVGAFAPLYWIAPRAELLIVAQSLLFALSVFPVYLFLRRRLPAGPSLALTAAYGLFWGLQRAATFDVHEVAFAPLVIAIILLAMDTRRWVLFWVSAVVLVLVKEDLIPLLTVIGVYLLIVGERRAGGVLLVSSVAAFVFVIRGVIPFFGDGGYRYGGPYAELLRTPWRIPAALVTPAGKLLTASMWLAPFALLPLFSPFALLLIPFVLSRLLSDVPAHWGLSFHYSAPLAPILAMAAGDALARIGSRVDDVRLRRRTVNGFAGACVVLSLFLPGSQPMWDLLQPENYRYADVHRSGYAAIDLVPPGASVVAQASVLPHLSQRAEAYILTAGAPDADVVIAARGLPPWPEKSADEIRALVDERRARGYAVVFEENGWIVLRRK
jgi:uncharacterized membrane protein